MKYKNKILLILLNIIVLGLLIGCSGNDEEAEKTSDAEIQFAEDTVFAVNGELVSRGEWNLYALPEIEKTGKLYGEDIWNYPVDAEGKQFIEVMKAEIEKQIACVKIVAGKAEEMGIALTDDEIVEISIQTADYMDKLTPQQIKENEITEELVKKVYSENLLATKVFEYLTLNVDTNTDEELVRHMELQYVTVSKTYEDKDGNQVLYSDTEISTTRAKLEQFVRIAKSKEDGTLSDVGSEEYTVTTTIAGLDDLKAKFPEQLAGVAFWLRENEISDLLETDEAFFIFDCVHMTDKDATNAARIEIIEQREKEVFDAKYDEWAKEAVILHR